jgi:PAS domain S-box-containing protein
MDHDPISKRLQTIQATTDHLRTSLHVLPDEQQILRQQFERLLSQVDDLIQHRSPSAELNTFRVKLSDTLRALSDPLEIQQVACWMVVDQLGADLAFFAEIDEQREEFVIEPGYYRPGFPVVRGRIPLAAFEPLSTEHQAGRPVIVEDAQTDTRIGDGVKALLAGMQISASIGIPFMRGDKFLALLSVDQFAPRQWTADEVVLVKEIAGRAWAEVERARAEEALRQSEAKYRTLFNSIDEGFCIIEKVDTLPGEPSDFRYLETNRAFELQTGLKNAVGKTIRELVPNVEEGVMANYDRVVTTGEGVRFEAYVSQLELWIDAYAFGIGEPDEQQVAVLFTNITERKSSEKVLRENEVTQAFLLKLSDMLHSLFDPMEIQGEAARALGEHLEVNRVAYMEINDQEVTIHPDYTHQVRSIKGQYGYDEFRPSLTAAFKSGETVIIDDVNTYADFNESERAAYRAISTRAYLGVSLIKEGKMVAVLGVYSVEPCAWTQEEVRLTEETAERTWAAMERARAETALRESERLLQKALSAETVGVVFFSLNGQIKEVNDAFTRMSGYAREALVDEVYWEVLTPPEFLEVARITMKNLAVEGESPPYEKELIRPDGSRWWGLFAPTYLSGIGSDSQYVEFILDITERKQVEAMLSQGERHLAGLFAQAEVGLSELSLDGRFVQVNDHLCRMLRRSHDEMLSLSIEDVTHPEDIASSREAFAHVIQTGETLSFDKRYLRSDSTIVWANSSLRRLDKQHGEPYAVLAVMVDLTERKRAEAALRELEERRLLAVEAAGIGDWETDLINGTIYWSSRTYELFGVSPTITPSYGLMRSRIHPDDQNILFDVRQAGIRGAIPSRYRVEFRVRHLDGGWRWLEVRDRVFFAEGERQEAVLIRGTVMDITPRKLVEATERDQRLLAETLRDSVAELSTTQELEEVLARAVKVARHLVEYDAAVVILTENTEITHLWSDGLTRREKDVLEVWHYQNPISPTNPLYGAATQSRPIFFTDLKQIKKLFPLKALYSLLIVPILWENKRIGYFTLINRKYKGFGDADIAAFQAFAYQLAAAITNARLFIQAQEAAALKERQQFARDLHDAVSQNLFTASMMTETLVKLWDQAGDKRPEALLEINRVVRGAQAEMRSLLMELRPANLETTQFTKLLDQIVTAVRGRKQAEVTLQFEGEPVLPPEVHVAIYRIAQEALNNISKHAYATRITVTGRGGENHIELLIQDNGRGFDPNSPKSGLGMQTMRERADAIDAKLNIESSEGRGTSIHVVWSRMPS